MSGPQSVEVADPCCGSEPPRGVSDERGREWEFGDCWCTLSVGHEGLCFCGPCTERFGTPGWQKAVSARLGA